MCDPVTLATAAKVATVVSTGVSVIGAVRSGQAQEQAGRTQAELFRRQALRDREIAQLSADRLEKTTEAQAARARALLASGGRDISTGSALLIQTDFAEEAEFQKQLTIAGGDQQAATAEAQGAFALSKGKAKARSSLFRAGETLLQGGVQLASFG